MIGDTRIDEQDFSASADCNDAYTTPTSMLLATSLEGQQLPVGGGAREAMSNF